jgi:microcin C transport system permease protein
MGIYITKRLLLMIPTLFGILLLNFLIVQAAPGGPVEQLIARLSGVDQGATARISNASGGEIASATQTQNLTTPNLHSQSAYQGAYGLDPELINDIEKRYGFDKPAHTRFFEMLWRFVKFDFGDSFFKEKSVLALIAEKLPVSISLGLWTTLLVYGISIPLGIKKAVKDGSRFDVVSSTIIVIGDAIPAFLFALLLIILFAGGSYFQIFPLRGLTSPEWSSFSSLEKILDYIWHLILPITSMVVGGFASLTFLVKNSFIEEIRKQYVLTAKAKGLSESSVLYGHVFRNAMLIVIAGFPRAFVGIFFTSSLLIEIIFSLDGLGLLGFEAIMTRDYPVIFGTLFLYTLIGLILNLISDLTYVLVDPRINFENRSI